MAEGSMLWRPDAPQDPFSGSLTFYAAIAAAGFVVGWLVQVLGF
jgi:hypothetical protein